MAERIARSRSRIAPRTSIIPEMFSPTTSSTIAERPNMVMRAPVICARRRAPAVKYGSTPPALSWFVEGYRAASADIADRTAASACGTVISGPSRATM